MYGGVSKRETNKTEEFDSKEERLTRNPKCKKEGTVRV